jgi:signal transduction histidine kinase
VPGGAVGRLDVLLRAALELTAEHELDHILDRMVQRAAEVAGARFARSFLGVPGDHTERTGVAVELRLAGVDDDTRLPTDVETVVYRVVQEALTNVARHAAAAGAHVGLSLEGHCIQATVVDDGVGFAVGDHMFGSLELAGMRQRALLVGGRLDVISSPGEGTRVMLKVPG